VVALAAGPPGPVLLRLPHRPHPGLLPHLGGAGRLRDGCARAAGGRLAVGGQLAVSLAGGWSAVGWWEGCGEVAAGADHAGPVQHLTDVARVFGTRVCVCVCIWHARVQACWATSGPRGPSRAPSWSSADWATRGGSPRCEPVCMCACVPACQRVGVPHTQVRSVCVVLRFAPQPHITEALLRSIFGPERAEQVAATYMLEDGPGRYKCVLRLHACLLLFSFPCSSCLLAVGLCGGSGSCGDGGSSGCGPCLCPPAPPALS
jgi:hypothetical protein